MTSNGGGGDGGGNSLATEDAVVVVGASKYDEKTLERVKVDSNEKYSLCVREFNREWVEESVCV